MGFLTIYSTKRTYQCSYIATIYLALLLAVVIILFLAPQFFPHDALQFVNIHYGKLFHVINLLEHLVITMLCQIVEHPLAIGNTLRTWSIYSWSIYYILYIHIECAVVICIDCKLHQLSQHLAHAFHSLQRCSSPEFFTQHLFYDSHLLSYLWNIAFLCFQIITELFYLICYCCRHRFLPQAGQLAGVNQHVEFHSHFVARCHQQWGYGGLKHSHIVLIQILPTFFFAEWVDICNILPDQYALKAQSIHLLPQLFPKFTIQMVFERHVCAGLQK